MLKIKDNVDLKTLKKLGFKKSKIYQGKVLVDIYTTKYGTIDVRCDTRRIYIYTDDKEEIFDFFQSGLVEKVRDE